MADIFVSEWLVWNLIEMLIVSVFNLMSSELFTLTKNVRRILHCFLEDCQGVGLSPTDILLIHDN